MEHNKDKDSHHAHHIVPLKVYFTTLGALLVLTIVTVGASYVNFGSTANVLVSLGIASAKASLVLMFFMGLKYDTNINRAYILSSFGALVLLLGITAIDLWTRPQPTPVKVKSTVAPLSQEEFDKLMGGGAELVTKGKENYEKNCASCHGNTGMGDGVLGAALNPKPRNFQSPVGEWKNGNSLKAIYVTLAYGIPGSGMAPYNTLPPADRIALAHYVQSLSGGGEKVGKVDAKFLEATKADQVGATSAGPAKVALPIDFALERVLSN
jgi:caa(3)-type oxidase subunit IV